MTDERVRITVDGVEYEVPAGRTILQALDECGVLMQPGGAEIPHYCWHPKLAIDGSCRVCQVEVRAAGAAPGSPSGKLQIACNTPVAAGMSIDTKSERVRAAREGVMELLLINHPLDCPICDQAGECKLQDYAFAYGVPQSRMREPRRALRKRVELGPTIVFDQERCILCRRCVRFCREVTGTGELGVFDRADRSVVDTFPGTPLANDYSMNVADICPVGALTTKDFRFRVRVWFLEEKDGICTGCSRGCNIRIGAYENEVRRYVPRRNDAVNQTWICDFGRLTYKEIAREDRLARCLVKRPARSGAGTAAVAGALEEASVDEAVRAAAERLDALRRAGGGSAIAGVASAHASNEDLLAFRSLLDDLGAEIRVVPVPLGAPDELLLEAERAANAAGARELGFGDPEPLLERLRRGGPLGLVMLGHDLLPLLGDAGASALEGLDTLILLDLRHSALERAADVVFPVRHAAEKEGASYTNSAGLVQRVHRAVLPGPDVLDERDVLRRLGEALAARVAASRERVA